MKIEAAMTTEGPYLFEIYNQSVLNSTATFNLEVQTFQKEKLSLSGLDPDIQLLLQNGQE